MRVAVKEKVIKDKMLHMPPAAYKIADLGIFNYERSVLGLAS